MLPAGHVGYGFGQMSLSRTGRPEEEDVFAFLDEAAGGQLAYNGCIDGRIEREVEGLQSLAGIGMSMAQEALEFSVGSGLEFIGDDHGEELREA